MPTNRTKIVSQPYEENTVQDSQCIRAHRLCITSLLKSFRPAQVAQIGCGCLLPRTTVGLGAQLNLSMLWLKASWC